MFRPCSLVLGSRRTRRVVGQLVVACFAFFLSAASLFAGDLRVPIPKRSKYTPVQSLNRDGVKAVQDHDYAKAKKLFYKAYLIDPNDPFTLNNLGYMAELDGDSDRARRFYALSAEMGSDAIIDIANNDLMEGKPVSTVAGRAEDKGIQINRLNNQAIALLQKDRAPEADLVLQKALTVDPNNAFTLNNLGFAKEKEGELQAAYQFYTAAADRNSKETVEVSIDRTWRGHAISDVARDNARKLNRRMQNGDDVEARVAILNLRGVSALNRNDRRTGREFIQQAFKLAPEDAFTLNNMGYLAEMDGDRETADFYYERAREANQKNARIAVATRKEVEGKKIGDVADNTDQLVESQMEEAREARSHEGGPVVLLRRDNSTVAEPDKPAHEPPHERVSDENGELLLPAPAPDNSAPMPVYKEPTGNQGNGGLVEPLPDNEQPATVKEGDHSGGMIMPLPDDQQPGAKPPQPQQQQQKEGQHQGGMIMPLPDDQQPGAQQQPNAQQPGTQQQQPAPQSQQQQRQPQQSQPGLLLPPPDNPPQQQTPQQSQPQSFNSTSSSNNNIGTYTPPRASTNPGGYSTTTTTTTVSHPVPPTHISDEDQPKAKPAQKTQQQNGPPPKQISDEN